MPTLARPRFLRLYMAEMSFAAIIAGVAVLPLLFTLAVSDPFATPKLVGIGIAVSVASLLSVAAWRSRRSSLSDSERRSRRVAGAFLAWNAVAYLISGADIQGLVGERYQLQGLLASALYVLTLWATSRAVRSERPLRFLFSASVIAGVGVALFALIQVLGADIIWGPLTTRRAFSTIGQPNSMAAFLVMVMPLALALALVADRRRDLVLLTLALGVISAALLSSGSRGAFLAAVIAGAVWLLMDRRRSSVLRVMRWPAAGASAVLILGLIFLPGLREVSAAATSRSVRGLSVSTDQSAQEHLLLWNLGMRMALDSPLVGVGPERFPLVFPRYRERYLSEEWKQVFRPFRVESPHNVYVAIADSAGFPALALYLVLIGLSVRGYARIRRRCDGLPLGLLAGGAIAAIAAHLVSDMFMTADLSTSWLFWALLGGGVFGLGMPSVGRAEGGPTQAGWGTGRALPGGHADAGGIDAPPS